MERLSMNDSPSRVDTSKSLGHKVLTLMKRVAKMGGTAFKYSLVSKLFYLLESLLAKSNTFASKVHILLVYLLTEWHEDVTIRKHILDNYKDIYRQDFDDFGISLEYNTLMEPLCRVVQYAFSQSEKDIMGYLDLSDFSFFWFMACRRRIPKKSALAICEVMQVYMLRREGVLYFTVAEKIFNKLFSKFRSIEAM